MKIEKITIKGIKSHRDTSFTLENYNTFVGETNSGKSNILSAIRWFFNDLKLKKEDITHNHAEEVSVQITFLFDERDNVPTIFDQKYVEESKSEIRAYRNIKDLREKPQSPKYQLIKKGLEPKSIKRPDFGEIIFVPSIRELNDEFKFTANSTINKLVSKYVIERIKKEDAKNQHYNRVKDSIESLSDFIGHGEGSAFETLKNSLKKYMLDYGDIEIGFKLDPPNVDELIKNSFKPFVTSGGGELPLESQGMGFQRSLIFSLICNMAELDTSSNDLSLYLIEEPELFLHPNHQNYFRNRLMELSNQSNSQVLLTSHSPYFLNNIENYSQIKRISIKDSISNLREVSHDEVLQICEKNGYLIAEAKNACRDSKWTDEELKVEAERISKEDELRYLLWIDPNRANAFLSKKVILVEGSTEKALFSFLFNNYDGDFYSERRTSDLTVVDVNGKYHFYKFANLLYQLGIPVWILYDGDRDKEPPNELSHKKLNEYIIQLKNDGVIIGCLRLDPELEPFIGIDKDGNMPDISIYDKLTKNNKKCRDGENYKKITEFVKQIIKYNL